MAVLDDVGNLEKPHLPHQFQRWGQEWTGSDQVHPELIFLRLREIRPPSMSAGILKVFIHVIELKNTHFWI